MQDNVQLFSEFIESVPYLDGSLVEGVTIPALTTTLVNHQLGRAYRGWITLRVEALPADLFSCTLDNDFAPGVTSQVTVVFDLAEVNVGGNYDTSTGLYTAPRVARYAFGGNIRFQATNDDDIVAIINSTPSGSFADGATFTVLRQNLGGNFDSTFEWFREVRFGVGNTSAVVVSCDNSAYNISGSAFQTRFYGHEMGDPIPYIDSTSTADTSLFLPLQTGRECTVDLWVF